MEQTWLFRSAVEHICRDTGLEYPLAMMYPEIDLPKPLEFHLCFSQPCTASIRVFYRKVDSTSCSFLVIIHPQPRQQPQKPICFRSRTPWLLRSLEVMWRFVARWHKQSDSGCLTTGIPSYVVWPRARVCVKKNNSWTIFILYFLVRERFQYIYFYRHDQS